MTKENVVKIWGHRGCIDLPENTLPAFDYALTYADGIEFDVWKTADGELVVIHDDTVNRTTDGNGNVSDFTLAELRALKVKNKKGEIVEGVVIPTLQEVLDLLADYQSRGQMKGVNIELKGPGVAADVVEMVQGYITGKALQSSNIIISSFNHEALAEVKQLDEELLRGLLYEPWDEEKLAQLVDELEPYSIHANIEDLLEGKTSPFEYSRPIGVWARGEKNFDAAIVKQLVEKGVEIIITNFPKEAKECVASDKWQGIIRESGGDSLLSLL